MSSTGIDKELYCDYALFYNNITCLSDINISGLSIFNTLTNLSTYSNLNIENLKITSTTLLNKTNFNNLSINGASTFFNTLNISGNTTINNSLNVISNITGSGISLFNLNTTTNTIFNNLNNFSTNASISITNLSTASLINKTNFNNLLVTGSSTFYSNLSIYGNINISGNTIINNVLTVSANVNWGYVTLNSGALGNQVGYIAFFNDVKVRRGYIGWEDTTNYLTMACENGLFGYRIKGGSLVIENNLNITGTSIINGVSTFLNSLNVSGASTFRNTLNVVGNITTSGISVFNLNTTTTTNFNNLNSFSTNAQLQINNLFITKQNNLTVQNPFTLSTNSNLSINLDPSLFIDASGNLKVASGGATQWTTTGTNIFYSSGNVGIFGNGTSPKLVIGDSSITGTPAIELIRGDINNFGSDVRGDWRIYNKYGSLYFLRADTYFTNISFCINAEGNVGINSEFPSSKLEIFDLTYSEAITQSTPNYNSAIKVYKTSDSVIGNTTGSVICNFLQADNTKGIAISHDGLMCSGLNQDQDFNICSKGTGKIILQNDTSITGALTVSYIFGRYIQAAFSSYGSAELTFGYTGNYCGRVVFYNASGQPRGNIGYKSDFYTNYLQIQSEPLYGCLGYHMNGNLIVSGTIGIGDEAAVPLYVKDGPSTASTYYKAAYFGYDGTYVWDVRLEGGNFNFSNISIYSVGTILSGRWIAGVSDQRIKKEIEDINDDSALQKILSIQPKTYKYIDVISKGNNKIYGFIAQQIKEIIPEAVQTIKECIPNIYKVFNISGDTIETNEDLRNKLIINDIIQIMDYNKGENQKYKIIEITANYIKIDKSIEGDKCFIYGKEINDFHTLSKEYIFTLNVCATQELYKLIQQQQLIINDLQNRISILENKNI